MTEVLHVPEDVSSFQIVEEKVPEFDSANPMLRLFKDKVVRKWQNTDGNTVYDFKDSEPKQRIFLGSPEILYDRVINSRKKYEEETDKEKARIQGVVTEELIQSGIQDSEIQKGFKDYPLLFQQEILAAAFDNIELRPLPAVLDYLTSRVQYLRDVAKKRYYGSKIGPLPNGIMAKIFRKEGDDANNLAQALEAYVKLYSQ